MGLLIATSTVTFLLLSVPTMNWFKTVFILFLKASIQVLRQESERSKDSSTPLKASTYSHPFVVHQSRDEQIQAARRSDCCNKCVCWSLLGVPTVRIHFWIIYDTLCNVIMSRVWKWHAWSESERVWELTLYTEVYYVHIRSNTVWSMMKKEEDFLLQQFFFLKRHHFYSIYSKGPRLLCNIS